MFSIVANMAAVKKCYFGNEAAPALKKGTSHFQLGYLDRVLVWMAEGYKLVVDAPVRTVSTINLSDHVPVSFFILSTVCLYRTMNIADS